MSLWRHGDILIQTVDTIPQDADKMKKPILAAGDATGHRHQIKDAKTARLYRTRQGMFLEVVADSAELVHPEHDTIVLPKGQYRVWRQREFSDFGVLTVGD